MDIFLKWRLRAIAKRLAPRRDFVLSLERHFLEKSGVRKTSPMLRWATAGITIGLVAMAGTGAYAYTSDEVLPDHPLYGVRQAVENVEEVIAVTPARKAMVRLKLLKRRQHEAELLAARRKRVPAATADDTKQLPTDTTSTRTVEILESKTESITPAAPTTVIKPTEEPVPTKTDPIEEPIKEPARTAEPKRELNYRLLRERWLEYRKKLLEKAEVTQR